MEETEKSKEMLASYLRKHLQLFADNLAVALQEPITRGVLVDMATRMLVDRCTKEQIDAALESVNGVWPFVKPQDPMLN